MCLTYKAVCLQRKFSYLLLLFCLTLFIKFFDDEDNFNDDDDVVVVVAAVTVDVKENDEDVQHHEKQSRFC